MMVDLPLTVDGTDAAFPNQPGPPSNGDPVLVRNRTYDVNPDINAANAQGKGWALERAGLPIGTQGFSVSGDRTQPIYYLVAGSTLFAERGGGWVAVLGNLANGRFGPVFANPYDATVVYALTTDQVIVVSTDSGSSFQPVATLNALVANAAVVNQFAFNYDRPAATSLCTEAGQVLFSPRHGVWLDLTHLLPSPLVPVRSIAIDCEAIYLATLGRGLMRIGHYL